MIKLFTPIINSKWFKVAFRMATYNEVLDIPNHPEVYLIDVRNKKEIAESGSLPESLNIPCKFSRIYILFKKFN